MNSEKKIRLRFAPSPTGNLHIGSVRTALFNWVYAKHFDGEVVLRIEDTDLKRSSKEFEANILEGLDWLGLEMTEGPNEGGDLGPYRQSERIHKQIYAEVCDQLIASGHAYYCFDSYFQYFLCSSSLGVSYGRTTLNPTKGASVCHHLLFGICGSLSFHFFVDGRLAADLRRFELFIQDPPRTTLGYTLSPYSKGFFTSDLLCL